MRGYTAGIETVHQLFCEFLIGDDANGLGLELLDHLESKLDHIRFSILVSIVEDGVWSVTKDLVDELVTESLSDVWGSPEHAEGDATLEDDVSAGANAGAGGDEDHSAEHGDDPQNIARGDITDPQFGWRRVVEYVRSPVTNTGDYKSSLVGGKAVPLLGRAIIQRLPALHVSR